MVRTHSHVSEARLDFGRILGVAAAIAVHALAFLLLLIPMAAPMPDAAPVAEPETRWVIPKEVEPTPIPTVVPVTPIPRTPPPRTAPRVTPNAPVVPTTPAVIDSGNTEIAATGSEGETVVPAELESGADPGGPVSVGQLAYLTATPPPYPRSELIAGNQGTVLLKVLVDIDGKPLEVTIERSSGNRNLDRAAQRHVLKAWQFQPAMRDGRAVQAYGLVPVVFSLQ